MPIQIVEVKTKKELTSFIRFPYFLYQKDPCWIAPLEMERREFFNHKKNPFFRHGEAQLFLALKDGSLSGRISAQIHHGHLEKYQDSAGFFGFFESIKDEEVTSALLQAAQDWLLKKGMKKMRGPFHFTMSVEQPGILIDGFDTPSSIMMYHNHPYYSSLLEGQGLKKLKDFFAWHYEVGSVSESAKEIAAATREYPGLEIRTIDMKNFDEEVSLIMQLFNEAWAENWGFIPVAEDEMKQIAKDLKPIIDPELVFIATVNNDPAAFAICLPNINEAICDLKGRLFPLGWAKLIWRLKKGLKSSRMIAMGIRKPYRGGRVGVLSVLMNVEMHRRAILRGYKTAELSWTLEDNEKINRGIEFMGGRRYKTYRVYEKEL